MSFPKWSVNLSPQSFRLFCSSPDNARPHSHWQGSFSCSSSLPSCPDDSYICPFCFQSWDCPTAMLAPRASVENKLLGLRWSYWEQSFLKRPEMGLAESWALTGPKNSKKFDAREVGPYVRFEGEVRAANKGKESVSEGGHKGQKACKADPSGWAPRACYGIWSPVSMWNAEPGLPFSA